MAAAVGAASKIGQRGTVVKAILTVEGGSVDSQRPVRIAGAMFGVRNRTATLSGTLAADQAKIPYGTSDLGNAAPSSWRSL
ncbi:MAG: hypothetical protein KDA71_10980 [Planctomycetales bacterium]|nr:hypothetical protein [Planctomycetales bacterium]